MNLNKIKSKLKKYGLAKFVKIAIKIVIVDLFLISKSLTFFCLRKLLILWKRKIYKLAFSKDRNNENILYAFYDLAVSPKTFDIVTFLVLAEYYRIKKGYVSSQIIIVPGSDEPKYFSSYTNENKEWRIKNILIPACFLYAKNSVTLCMSRKQAADIEKQVATTIFPETYTIAIPLSKYSFKDIVNINNYENGIPSLSASQQAIEYVKMWMNKQIPYGKSAISITLRESTYEVDRNSNLSAWGDFSQMLNPNKYIPVIIRDVEKSFKPVPPELENILIFNEATWHLDLRVAFYELCFVNMFVNNGPTVIAYFNSKIRYLVFKMITSTSGATTKEYYKEKLNFPQGSQLKTATPFQKIVWENDDLDVIEREFKLMSEKIESTNHQK
jgi:hypothetical protein